MINNVRNPTLRAFLKYKDHPIILAFQNKCKNRNKFSFEETDFSSIEKKVHNLKINIASQTSDITTKLLKKNIDIFTEFLWKRIRSPIISSTFSSCLKSADVTPLHRKGKTDKTDNYILRNHMYAYFDKMFSKYQYGFRKGCNTG